MMKSGSKTPHGWIMLKTMKLMMMMLLMMMLMMMIPMMMMIMMMMLVIIRPGPLAPPGWRRPRRNITALSYSCTTCTIHKATIHTKENDKKTQIEIGGKTLTQVKRLKGRVARTRRKEKPVRIKEAKPGLSGSSGC